MSNTHTHTTDWWLSCQRLHSLNDSLQPTLYCHINTWFVTCSLWICHYELLYIYGINDVWILNLWITHLCIWDSAKFVMHVNSVLQIVAFIMPGRSAKFNRYCLTPWNSKLPRSFEIHWVRHNLVNVVIFGIKNLKTYEMTIKLSSNDLVR